GTGAGAVIRANNSSLVCPQGRSECPQNYVKPGEIVEIFATGLGPVSVPVADGAPDAGEDRITSSITLYIGGTFSRVLYAGLAPGFVGLYQINAVVPSNVPSGDDITILIVEQSSSPTRATLAVRAELAATSDARQRGGPSTSWLDALASDPANPS